MLKFLSRTHIPLVWLVTLSLTQACGKEMSESKDSSDPNIERQDSNQTLITRIPQGTMNYLVPYDGRFKLPKELKVNAGTGSTKGKTVTIFYNLNQAGRFTLKCLYKGVAAGDRIFLNQCLDEDNRTFGPVEYLLSATWFLDKGFYIQIQNPDGVPDLEAVHHMEWTYE